MVGKKIEKYILTREVGEGGMAKVYEAKHESLGHVVAIKILKEDLINNTYVKNLFIKEARFLATLQHENIIRVIDTEELPHQISIIMEFVSGKTLKEKVEESGPLTQKEVYDIFSQILSALEYCHYKNIIHRDIKPSNIIILPNGKVKVYDFGIAKEIALDKNATRTTTQMGTPNYMSPEHIIPSNIIDHRSDIYSLGITLFYAINGFVPYDYDSIFEIQKHIIEDSLPEFKNKSIYKELVLKACEKQKKDRFQSCSEWKIRLKELYESGLKKDEETLIVRNNSKSDQTIHFPDKKTNNKDETLIPADKESDINSIVLPEKKNSNSFKIGNKKLNLPFIVSIIAVFILITLGIYYILGRNNDTADSIAVSPIEIKEIRIGRHNWTVENLNTTTFQNGDPIIEAKSNDEWEKAAQNKQPAWCYYNNDSSSNKKYGILYNWYAVYDSRGLAPNGWHIPNEMEWNELIDSLGGPDIAGNKLKSQTLWNDNGNGNNESGFSGMPGGYRNESGVFSSLGFNGIWWSSSSTNDQSGIAYFIYNSNSLIFKENKLKSNGLSVRCIKY
jgi:uncharacterized protein (TIGR02145 family)